MRKWREGDIAEKKGERDMEEKALYKLGKLLFFYSLINYLELRWTRVRCNFCYCVQISASRYCQCLKCRKYIYMIMKLRYWMCSSSYSFDNEEIQYALIVTALRLWNSPPTHIYSKFIVAPISNGVTSWSTTRKGQEPIFGQWVVFQDGAAVP